jgi:predicted anti-sigma-YlaC factor YlaD
MSRIQVVRRTAEEVDHIMTRKVFPSMTFFQTAWRLLNMPCEGMTRVASESLDRNLSLLEAVVLRSHLIYCSACRRYLLQLRFMRSEFRRLARLVDCPESLSEPRLSDEIRERIKRELRRH